MVRKVTSCVALCLVILTTGLIHARIPPTTSADRGEAFVPDPAIARVLALGFHSVLADYYWLQAVQAIGGHTVISAELGVHLGKLVDLVTSLDPWVDHPYRFAAVWLTESEENVRTANRLLDRGIAHHPNEWRNLFYKGFNHFFYLMENEAAAEALDRASKLPGSARYLPRLVARLRSQTADIDVAEAFLLQLLHDAKDDGERANYQNALDEIEVEKKARYLDRAREAFKKLNGRDIMSVEELAEGPSAVVPRLPSPEPDSLPNGLSRDSVWKLDLESERILSTYYGDRYQLHFASWERDRAEGWAEERKARDAASEEGTNEEGASQ